MDEPGLTIEAVYHDADLVELHVAAWNGRFGGHTSVYVAPDEPQDFAELLSGFPTSAQDTRSAEWGELDASAANGGVSLEFRCVDAAAHCAVWVHLKAANTDPISPQQTVRLFLPLEPASVDLFVAELRAVGEKKHGLAYLRSGPTRG